MADDTPQPSPLLARAVSPPGLITFTITLSACLLLLTSSSSPGFGPDWLFMLSTVTGLIAAAWWMARCMLAVVLRCVAASGGTKAPFPRMRWIGPPLLGIAAVAISLSDLPLKARWSLSRSAMDRLAVQARAADSAIRVDGRVGLYHVDEAWRNADDEIEIHSASFGAFAQSGIFIHVPGGQVTPIPAMLRTISLGRGWHAVITD